MVARFQPIPKTLIRCLWLILIVGLIPLPARAEEALPAKAYVFGVKGRPQTFSLSCESRSAVDWAAYFGVEISEKKFLNHLPRSDNPNQGFVGHPGDPLGDIPPRSYGVHAGPVAALLREYGLPAQAHYDLDLNKVKEEIAADRPVIVWVIGQMWNGTPIQYTASDGEQTAVAHYEHTMILVGYTPKTVSAIDAATGQEGTYALNSFLTSWKVLGRMAVTMEGLEEGEGPVNNSEAPAPTPQIPAIVQYPTISPPQQTPDPIVVSPTETATPTTESPIETPPPTIIEPTQAPGEEAPRIYTVRRGDYLTAIAKRFGVNWRNLARANHLSAPYILYTGQKLRIP